MDEIYQTIFLKAELNSTKAKTLQRSKVKRGFQPGEPGPHQASSPALADASTLEPQSLLATEGTRPWAHI